MAGQKNRFKLLVMYLLLSVVYHSVVKLHQYNSAAADLQQQIHDSRVDLQLFCFRQCLYSWNWLVISHANLFVRILTLKSAKIMLKLDLEICLKL